MIALLRRALGLDRTARPRHRPLPADGAPERRYEAARAEAQELIARAARVEAAFRRAAPLAWEDLYGLREPAEKRR